MIRATLVLLAAWVVVPRLRHRSAAERHLLWLLALCVAAALPPLSLVVPAWRPEWAARIAQSWPVTLDGLDGWAFQGGPDVVVRATGVESVAWAWTDWLALSWALGSLGVLLLLAAEGVKLARLLSSAEPITDPRCAGISRAVSHRLGLARAPLLLCSAQALMPMTWGSRRPRVLLPGSSVDWSDERLEAVLAHEFAHIRRRDWLAHMIAQAVCAAYWFHPLCWAAQRAICREGEQAADDDALRLGLDAGDYAAHLVEIVRSSRVRVPAPTMAMARASHLEKRVQALLDRSLNRRAVSSAMTRTAAAVGIAVAVPLAAVAPAGAVDVDVRTLDLAALMPTSAPLAIEPPPPAVRRVRVSSASLDADVAPAIAEYTTPPLYSDRARQRGVEGVITIGVRVGADGRLTRLRVVKGLGDGLDQNALVALRQWRFLPGTREGRPVAMDVEVDVEFNLQSQAVNELIANDMATLVGPGVAPPRVVRTGDRLPAGEARGTVILDVVLLEDGSPRIVRILQSLSPEADESAVSHFEQWRFSPATKNGVPVKVRMNAEVRFR